MLAKNGVSVALDYRCDDVRANAALEEIRAIAPDTMLAKADLADDPSVRAMVAAFLLFDAASSSRAAIQVDGGLAM